MKKILLMIGIIGTIYGGRRKPNPLAPNATEIYYMIVNAYNGTPYHRFPREMSESKSPPEESTLLLNNKKKKVAWWRKLLCCLSTQE